MALATLATDAEVKAYLGLTAPTAQQSAVLTSVEGSIQQLINDFLGFSPIQQSYEEFYPENVNLKVRSEFVDGYERSGTNKVVPIERYVTERRIIPLRNTPVRSITSVYENPDAWLTAGGSWPAGNLLTEGTDYSLDVIRAGLSLTGFLMRMTGPWTTAERCVKVTYVSGYSTLEMADYPIFKDAYLVAVQIAYNERMMHMRNAGMGGFGVGVLVQQHIDSWGVQYDAETNAKLYGMQTRLPLKVARMLEPYVGMSRYV